MQKVAVVTGVSGGFGLLIIQRLAGLGYQVIALTRHPDAVAEIANVTVLGLDVAQTATPASVAQLVADRFDGRVDLLINNAGFSVAGPLEAVTDKDISDQFEVNCFGLLRLTRTLLPSIRSASGRIINLSSVLGFTAMPFQGLYCASKFAVEGLTETLYHEMKPFGVQVMLIEPGGFRTGFSGNMRWVLPETEVYESRIDNMRRILKNRSEQIVVPGSPRDPNRVVGRIVALAVKGSARLRHRIGLDAHALYYLRRLLPQALAERVLVRLFAFNKEL